MDIHLKRVCVIVLFLFLGCVHTDDVGVQDAETTIVQGLTKGVIATLSPDDEDDLGLSVPLDNSRGSAEGETTPFPQSGLTKGVVTTRQPEYEDDSISLDDTTDSSDAKPLSPPSLPPPSDKITESAETKRSPSDNSIGSEEGETTHSPQSGLTNSVVATHSPKEEEVSEVLNLLGVVTTHSPEEENDSEMMNPIDDTTDSDEAKPLSPPPPSGNTTDSEKAKASPSPPSEPAEGEPSPDLPSGLTKGVVTTRQSEDEDLILLDEAGESEDTTVPLTVPQDQTQAPVTSNTTSSSNVTTTTIDTTTTTVSTTLIPKPQNPECNGQIVSFYTADKITFDLTKITTDNVTKQLCIYWKPSFNSENKTCVSKDPQSTTITGLQSGTLYTFSIFAVSGNLQSLKGCSDISQTTRPDDPVCSEGLKAASTKDRITFNLANIKTGNRTQQLCFQYDSPSVSGNVSCVETGLDITTISGLLSGTRYSFSIYSLIQNNGVDIKSLGGCSDISTFTRPEDPVCSEGLISAFTKDRITFNLTKIKTGERTQQICFYYDSPSSSGNVSCVNKDLAITTISGLLSGTRYSFFIYSLIKVKEVDDIKSLGGCNISKFTRPEDPVCSEGLISAFTKDRITFNLTKIKTGERTQQICFHYDSPSSSGNVSCVNTDLVVTTLSGLLPGTQYSFFVYSLMKFNGVDIKSLGGCNISKFTRPSKPTCNETSFYEASATTVYIHPAACHADGFESFDIGLVGEVWRKVLPNTSVTFDGLKAGDKFWVSVTAVGTNGVKSTPNRFEIYTKPVNPSCSKAKFLSTNNSITILGESISAEGAKSYKIWDFKNPNISSRIIVKEEDATFYHLTTSTNYTFSVQSISQYRIFSKEGCNISAATRPNNPDCRLATISNIGTHTFTLDLNAMKTVGAVSYFVEYTTFDTKKKNVTFTPNSLDQQLSMLASGSMHTVMIHSIGIQNLLSLQGCTKTSYTRPTIPADNAIIYNDTSSIAIEWTHSDGKVENYTVEKSCSCENSTCKPCTPSAPIFKITDAMNSVNISGLNPGTYCNVSIFAVSGSLNSDPLQMLAKSSETEPGNVSSFVVTEVTTNSLSVVWEEPVCTNGDILHYNVTISNEQGSIKTNLVDAIHNTTSFKNLQTGTFYNITIAAVNTAGEGSLSYLQVYTREAAPSEVNYLQATNMSSTSISVVWKKPTIPNGIINKYEVVVQSNSVCVQKILLNCNNCVKTHKDDSANLKGSPNQKTILPEFEKCTTNVQQNSTYFTENNSRNFSIVVDHLKFFMEYRVFVWAFTSVGAGPVSNTTVRTSEDKPSVPLGLKGNSISESNISLEFQTPKFQNGRIVRLDIKYEYKTQNTCLSEDLGNETRIAVVPINNSLGITYHTFLQNLYSYWDYTISVRMATSAGSGNYSNSITIRTKPDVPETVRGINPGNSTSRSVHLTWKKPCHPNGIIEYYLIKTIDGEMSKVNLTHTPSNDTSYNVTGLYPYRQYSFSISAKVVGVNKNGEPTLSRQVDTSTEAAKKPRQVTFTSTPFSADLNWIQPSIETGPTHYTAVAIDQRDNTNTSSCSTTGYMSTACTIHNLHPYWNYSVTVSAITDPFGPNSTTIIIDTTESAPGKVSSFTVSQVQNVTAPREVMLSWTSPSERDRNGIIRRYFIQYWVKDYTGRQTDEVKTLSYAPDIFSTNITEILPENTYFFQIFPFTIANATEKDYVSEIITISAGAPIPVKLPKSVTAISLGPSAKLSNDERQLSVSLNYRSLCDSTNGNPDSWYIIVAEESSIPEKLSSPFHGSRTDYNNSILKEYKTWSNVHSQDHFEPYIATATLNPGCIKYRRHKRATVEKTVDVLIGQEKDCDGVSKTYCNGYLKPDNKYKVRFAVCTSNGCLESEFSTPLTTKPNLVPVIAGSVSAVVAVIVVVVVILVLLKRNRKGPFQDKTREVERGNDNANFTTELETVTKPRPVKIADFAQHVHKMHADSNLLFSKEYKLLKDTCPTHTTKAAETQVNRIKNRYTNILAYDHSRVKLLPTEDDEGSDYINANYIAGYNSEREYIATQGPLPFTRDEFWRMIWEQNVSIIVMLTQLIERGRRKCDIYWPEATREPVYYGDLVVEIESESTLPDYVLRVMSVKLGDRTRKVKQLHYLKWPDMGCPDTTMLLLNFVGATRLYLPHTDPGPVVVHCSKKTVKHFSYLAWPDMGIPETSEAMLKFAKEVRSHQSPPTTNRGPFVVHCSAGVGRTGTYIAVDYLMQHVRTSDVIDIYNLVMGMRNNRPNMVQTEDQYIFIHDCIKDFIHRGDDDDSEEEEGQDGEVNPIYANM